MAKQVTNKDIFNSDLFLEEIKKAKLLLKALDEVEKGFKDVAKASQKTINSEDQKSIQSVQKTKEAIEQLNQVEKASIKVKREKEKLQKTLEKNRLAELKLQKDREKAFDRADKQEQKAIKNAQKLRKSTIDNANAFKKLTKQTNNAQARFKRLAAQYGETDSRTKKALATFNKLDSKLRSINNTARDGRRDVGRYGLAFSKLGATLKSGLGAVGVGLGITAIAGAFRNTFNRIREFDKELQNISGVTGIARKDLKSLEKEIISVAGSSIKTSNEVAQLASTLFTLGNTEKEVKLLLKPVNDLSIALGATSEESADFLGQTLNAFGKGAESGQEFADIIANVRTSTSLDFQRIKDALGFVAPTANALGLSLGQVSAQIGVLQDNGIKVARAGRLLNTSFARLVKQGKTLDEALKEINESQDKVSTATNLFGAESFTLGLILADNVEKTSELANEFDNLSDGSLQKLTDEQLKSLDAQLKIVDSSWEKLILSIEKGDGKIGKAINSSLAALSKFLNFVAEGEKTRTQIIGEEGDKRAAKLITDVQREGKTEEERINNLKNLRSQALKNLRGFNADVGKAQRELSTALNEEFRVSGNEKLKISLGEIKESFDKNVLGLRETETRINSISNKFGLSVIPQIVGINKLNESTGNLIVNNKELNDANTKVSLAVQNRIKEEKLLAAIELELNKEVEVNTKLTDGNTKAKTSNAKTTRELTGLIEKQAKVVSDLNTEIKRATSEEQILELSFELDVEKEELDRLRRIVSSSLEEINKIELDLIEDATEKRIAKEREKSKKLIEQIRTNSRAEESVKNDLIVQENERLLDFELNEAIKSNKERIKQEADFARAEFEQRRTGFKTEEAFEKEKAKQFKAIKRNQLQAELDLLEFSGRDKDKLRIEQLKADLEGLNELGKGFEELQLTIGDVVQVIADEIDKAFEKRIEAIGEKLDKTGENIGRLRDKAQEGRLESEESLAFEQKQEIELARQKEREQKRQQRTQAFFSVLSSFQANDGNLAKTISDISVLKALAGGFTAFDGVDDTGGRGNIDSKGGKAWILHPNEQVWSKADRNEVGFRSREEVKDIVKMFDSGTLNDLMLHDYSNQFMNPGSFILNGMNNAAIESKLDSIDKGINNIVIPENHFDYDLIRNLFIHHQVKGNKKTTTNSKLF